MSCAVAQVGPSWEAANATLGVTDHNQADNGLCKCHLTAQRSLRLHQSDACAHALMCESLPS